MCSMPASSASSTAYWTTGRSTTVSISLGTDFVAGRNRVPSPATGITAFFTLRMSIFLRRLVEPPRPVREISLKGRQPSQPDADGHAQMAQGDRIADCRGRRAKQGLFLELLDEAQK